jgi:hypothetical protein
MHVIQWAEVGMTVLSFTHPRAAATANAQGPTSAELREQARQDARDAAQQARDAAQQARDAAQEAANNARIADGNRNVRIQTPDGAVTITRDGPPAPPSFPGMIQPGGFNDNMIPPQAVDIAMGFFTMCAVIVIGWPLARAFGRRLERRGADVAAVPPVMTEQLQRIEQAVEAMAIEVERISESQRFMAKLQSTNAERVPLPAERR